MLPSVNSAVPASSSASLAATALATGLGTDAAAAARQQLTVAVPASGSAAAFNPDQNASRQARRASTPTIGAQVVVEADAPVPASTTNVITLPAAPLPQSFFGSSPLTLGIPFTSQLAAQFYAQEGNVPGLQQPANSNDAPDIDEEAASQVRDIRVASGDLRAASVASRALAYGSASLSGQPRLASALTTVSWKTQLAPKKVGVADARGASAYGVAEARNQKAAISVDTAL